MGRSFVPWKVRRLLPLFRERKNRSSMYYNYEVMAEDKKQFTAEDMVEFGDYCAYFDGINKEDLENFLIQKLIKNEKKI